jgi:hypothetical protein
MVSSSLTSTTPLPYLNVADSSKSALTLTIRLPISPPDLYTCPGNPETSNSMTSTISQRIRVGVIGLSTQGWACWGLIPPMLQLKDSPYEIAAICTSKPKSPEQQEVLRSKYGRDLKIYSSPQEMAQAPDIDLIVVSVKAPDHEKAVMPALDGGLAKKKDIFIEWPACGNLKVCQIMAEKANKLGIRVMVGLQGRQSPVLKKVSHIHIPKFAFSRQSTS